MIPDKKLHEMTFEELIDLYGELRFGSSMLVGRTLHAFNYFVQQGIFYPKSKEGKTFNKWRSYSTQDGISEYERLRRWFVMFVLFEYPELLRKNKR